MFRVVVLRVVVLSAVAAFGLWAQAPPKLAIERLMLQQYEDGDPLPAGYEFVPGETAYFSCRIAGFLSEQKDESRAVRLTWHLRILDPDGVPIDKDRSGVIQESLSSQDKNWTPKFLSSFLVPAFAPSGSYKIPVEIEDAISHQQVSGQLTFRVRGHDVQPSETLALRSFRFLRAEDDQVPMQPAVYTPGDTLWAKFDIVGFKFGDANHFSVDYGLAILNAAGEPVFSQPVAASDEHQSFYPQRYVPGAISLHLDATVVKAPYTLLLTVHDKISHQTFESRQPFEVK